MNEEETLSTLIRMKEQMRKYFLERYEDSDSNKLTKVALALLSSKNKDYQRSKCEGMVQTTFRESDELRLLAGALKKFGCNFTLARHVACELCHNCAGGYDPDTQQIVICQNSNPTPSKILTTMMHEMIHMFDYCRANFDFDNLEHVACSEIRAANLTYCSITDRFQFRLPDFFSLKKTHHHCVKEVAFQSVKAYSPETDDDTVWKIVHKVFPYCYNDLEPFGRRPLNGSHELKHSYRERYHLGYIY